MNAVQERILRACLKPAVECDLHGRLLYTEREFFILIRGFFSFLVLDESKGVE